MRVSCAFKARGSWPSNIMAPSLRIDRSVARRGVWESSRDQSAFRECEQSAESTRWRALRFWSSKTSATSPRRFASNCRRAAIRCSFLRQSTKGCVRRALGAAVLVIDRMLQGQDGLSIIEALRAEGNATPALVISALSSVDDRINGLKAGGDDYLVKPFDIRELTARVEALLRRGGDARLTRLQVGALEMDLVERSVRCDGKPVDLLPREFTLLEYFMRRPGPGRDPGDAARGCLEFQIHGANECRRRADRQSAAQARPYGRATLHRQYPRCRLQTECGRLRSSRRGRFASR